MEWRDVCGYEGYYQVSNTGIVRSVDRNIIKSNGIIQHRFGRICAMRINKDGYKIVKLSRNSISRTKFVHRLVYETFVGSIPGGFDIDHIDFDRTNNNVDNLQAMTHADNVHKTVLSGRHFTSQNLTGSNNPNYGNHRLSNKYAENKDLALQKQSRKGAQNGRALRIEILSANGFHKKFGFIREAAEYIKQLGCKYQISTICFRLSEAAKNNDTYFGFTIRFM